MSRRVTEVGPGDYVKVNGHWEVITENTAYNAPVTPRTWSIRTQESFMRLCPYDMYDIEAYAKAGDPEVTWDIT